MIQAIITFLHNLDWPSFIVGLFLGFVGTFMQDRAFPFLNRKRILYDESKKAPAVLVQEQLLKDLDLAKGSNIYQVGISCLPDRPRSHCYTFHLLSSESNFDSESAVICRISNRNEKNGYSLMGLQCTSGKFVEAQIWDNQIEPRESLTLVIEVGLMPTFSSLQLESGNFVFQYDIRYENETRNPTPKVSYRQRKNFFTDKRHYFISKSNE